MIPVERYSLVYEIPVGLPHRLVRPSGSWCGSSARGYGGPVPGAGLLPPSGAPPPGWCPSSAAVASWGPVLGAGASPLVPTAVTAAAVAVEVGQLARRGLRRVWRRGPARAPGSPSARCAAPRRPPWRAGPPGHRPPSSARCARCRRPGARPRPDPRPQARVVGRRAEPGPWSSAPVRHRRPGDRRGDGGRGGHLGGGRGRPARPPGSPSARCAPPCPSSGRCRPQAAAPVRRRRAGDRRGDGGRGGRRSGGRGRPDRPPGSSPSAAPWPGPVRPAVVGPVPSSSAWCASSGRRRRPPWRSGPGPVLGPGCRHTDPLVSGSRRPSYGDQRGAP